jgi:hypothetical protein
MKKMLLQMTSVSLQPVPSLVTDVNRLKNDARKAIEQEFNIVGFENDRTALVLKSKYEILNKKNDYDLFRHHCLLGIEF